MTATNARSGPTLHHVNMKTRRMDDMIEWYGTVVGATIQHKFAGGAWLTNDEANHRIAFLTSDKISDDPEKLQHTGMHHLAFEFKTFDELLQTIVRLADRGIEPHMCLDHGMTLSFYFVDPDGNSVELQVDTFGDWAQSSSYVLDSPEFKRDPIGTPFDSRKIAAAWKAGTPHDELHRRAFGGEFSPDGPLDLRFPV